MRKSTARYASATVPIGRPIEPVLTDGSTPKANGVQKEPAHVLSLHFSPPGEAKCVRGLSVRGTGRLARGGVLEQYGEHGRQPQRSNDGPIACFDRQVVRNAG